MSQPLIERKFSRTEAGILLADAFGFGGLTYHKDIQARVDFLASALVISPGLSFSIDRGDYRTSCEKLSHFLNSISSHPYIKELANLFDLFKQVKFHPRNGEPEFLCFYSFDGDEAFIVAAAVNSVEMKLTGKPDDLIDNHSDFMSCSLVSFSSTLEQLRAQLIFLRGCKMHRINGKKNDDEKARRILASVGLIKFVKKSGAWIAPPVKNFSLRCEDGNLFSRVEFGTSSSR